MICACLFCACSKLFPHYKLIEVRDTGYYETLLEESSKKMVSDHSINKPLPDADHAITAAEAYLFRVYGREQIVSERPYLISQYKGYWFVFGSLSKGAKGGVFNIVLNSRDSKVIACRHEK